MCQQYHCKTMKRSSSSGGSGRRRSRAVACAILAGCIVYIANTILYPPSTNYDHYVPGHRFLQVDGDQSNHKISLGQLQHKTTLNLRSEEDAAAVRKRSLQAGRKRQLRLLASDRNANLNDEGTCCFETNLQISEITLCHVGKTGYFRLCSFPFSCMLFRKSLESF